MQGLHQAQHHYDRYLPEDNRTDAEIERDIIESKRERDLYAHLPKFLVIERATGKPVGDGSPMPYGFAVYVRDVRDTFRRGDFYIQQIHPKAEAPSDGEQKTAGT